MAGTGAELQKLLEDQEIQLSDKPIINRKKYSLTTLSALLEGTIIPTPASLVKVIQSTVYISCSNPTETFSSIATLRTYSIQCIAKAPYFVIMHELLQYASYHIYHLQYPAFQASRFNSQRIIANWRLPISPSLRLLISS